MTAAHQQRSRQIGPRIMLAEHPSPSGTGQTVAAGGHKRKDNVIARREVDDARTDLAHDPSRLVAHHHRHDPRARAIDHRQGIGVTQASGGDLYQHLAAARA